MKKIRGWATVCTCGWEIDMKDCYVFPTRKEAKEHSYCDIREVEITLVQKGDKKNG